MSRCNIKEQGYIDLAKPTNDSVARQISGAKRQALQALKGAA